MAAGDALTRRLFLAIDVDDRCRDSFERLAARLASIIDAGGSASRGRVRWVAPGNFHLTIRFLGALVESEVRAIQSALARPLGARAFEMWFDRTGVFPERGNPRAVWVGASQGALEAEQVRREIERRVVEAGTPGDPRPVRAHVTLGRFRASGRSQDRRAISDHAMEPVGPLVVDHVTLYESHLSTGAPSYQMLLRTRLMS